MSDPTRPGPATGCTCSIPSATAHVCSEVPKVAYVQCWRHGDVHREHYPCTCPPSTRPDPATVDTLARILKPSEFLHVDFLTRLNDAGYDIVRRNYDCPVCGSGGFGDCVCLSPEHAPTVAAALASTPHGVQAMLDALPGGHWEPLPGQPDRGHIGQMVRRTFDGVTTTGTLAAVGYGTVWLGEHKNVAVTTAGEWEVQL